ncbi:fibroblast growth factor receptor 3-like [Ptychodera flava]|uniref:fibroblast growth factor receptor 3-like n=1 Tax=Ptychodera flava TaxID=63121 RepID=UPI003969E7BD
MCTSGSSNPQSEIIWYRDDDVIGASGSETIVKKLPKMAIPPNQPVDCTTSVTGWLDYVVEGESIELRCKSCSANPAAKIVWYRDGVLLTPDVIKLTDGMYNGQRAIGHLEKEISFSDHGAEYSCEASSPERFPNHIYQSQKVTLNVHYTPRIINDYDTNSTRINAGDGVILWCNISSNPRANITWLDQNESNTIALFISLSVTLVAILLVVVIVVFCKKRRGKQKSTEDGALGGNKNPSFEADALGKAMNPCMEVEFDSITFIEDRYTGVFSKLVKGEIPISKRSKLVVCVKVVKENARDNADEALLNEIRFLKRLEEHQNIIKMIGCSAEIAPYCIVYEYCPHGNLREYLIGLHKEVKRIDEYELEDATFNLLCNFASQIASGMAFLGEIECIHRALAARNIQVWHKNVCKISEFGFASKVMDVYTYEKMIEGRLPVRWMALESILECVYTAKSDVWSFGIVLWEIFNFGKRVWQIDIVVYKWK